MTGRPRIDTAKMTPVSDNPPGVNEQTMAAMVQQEQAESNITEATKNKVATPVPAPEEANTLIASEEIQAAKELPLVATNKGLEPTVSDIAKTQVEKAMPTEAKSIEQKGELTSGSDAASLAVSSRQLKKTCEACAKSKVKCEGSYPCDRCHKRGVHCEFMPEQKRGRRLGTTQEDIQNRAAGVTKRQLLTIAPRTCANNNVDRSSPLAISTMATAQNQEQLRHLQQQHLHQQQRVMFAQYGHGLAPQVAPYAQQGATVVSLNQAQQRPQSSVPGHFQLGMAGHSSIVESVPPGYASWNPTASSVGRGYMPPTNAFNNSVLLSTLQQPHLSHQFAPQLNTVLQHDALSFPAPFERRLIRTLFALFKYHHKHATTVDVMRKIWFESRFNTIWSMVAGRLTAEDERRFRSWCFTNQMRVDPSAGLGMFNPSVRKACPNFANIYSTPARQQRHSTGMSLGTVRVLSFGQVECSEEFTTMLGYHPSDLVNKCCAPGVLPWGAEVLCNLVLEDQDILGYVQAVASALQTGKTEGSAIVRAQVDRSISVAHKNGMRLDCTISSEVIESVTAEGCLSVGVTMTFSMASPESVFMQQSSGLDLGPWLNAPPRYSSIPTGWLAPLLQWVDS
jgi:hypothetical protein